MAEGTATIAGEPRALALKDVDHAQQVRIHRAGDSVAGRFPFADTVATQPCAFG